MFFFNWLVTGVDAIVIVLVIVPAYPRSNDSNAIKFCNLIYAHTNTHNLDRFYEIIHRESSYINTTVCVSVWESEWVSIFRNFVLFYFIFRRRNKNHNIQRKKNVTGCWFSFCLLFFFSQLHQYFINIISYILYI